MDLLNLFKYISDNYETQLQQEFKNNLFNQEIKKYLPQAIPTNLFGHNYSVKFSSGQGRWAYYPWIAIFDKTITSTAQKGYDVVLLFTNDYKEVYLSLNQGWNYYENTFGTRMGREYIKKVSDFWRDNIRLSEDAYEFSKDDISLDRNQDRYNTRGEGYSLGNIVSKHYIIEDLKDNEALLSDVIEMVSLLKDIKSKFLKSDDPIDATNRYIIKDNKLSELIAENEQRTLENNKKELILTNKTYSKKSRVSSNKVEEPTKKDYIEEAKSKQYNGRQGEDLVLKYELTRLSNNRVLQDYVDKIEHVSVTQGDGLGYDIKSFDLDDKGNVVELMIEVKTVTGNINTSINISLNEFKKAQENKNYKIYKVFNYQSEQPELIIINDINSDSLYFEPSGYLLKVKSIDRKS